MLPPPSHDGSRRARTAVHHVQQALQFTASAGTFLASLYCKRVRGSGMCAFIMITGAALTQGLRQLWQGLLMLVTAETWCEAPPLLLAAPHVPPPPPPPATPLALC